MWTFSTRQNEDEWLRIHPAVHSVESSFAGRGWSMRVQKVRYNGGYEFTLLDDEGLAIPVVSNFLSYLRARGCSPNTLCAYAHDLKHFYRFLKSASIQVQEFTPRRTLDFLQYLRAVPSRGKARTPPAAGINCGAAPQLIPQLAPTTVNRVLAA